MSDIYFVQVDGDAAEAKRVADSLGDFLKRDDAEVLVVPETVEPLDRDEAIQYLESMVDALNVDDDV
jgi:transcriptional/translational regulatory protein YebC/TACO1